MGASVCYWQRSLSIVFLGGIGSMSEYFIETERLGLRNLVIEDVYGEYLQWLNNAETCRLNSHHRYPVSISEIEKYIIDVQGSRSSITLAIIELVSKHHIGNISLQCINYIDRSAELAYLIGSDSWGKGYATEAGKALCIHAKETLNLHRLYLGTAGNNIGMQKVAEKLGFVREGIRREALYKENEYHNIYEYGLILE